MSVSRLRFPIEPTWKPGLLKMVSRANICYSSTNCTKFRVTDNVVYNPRHFKEWITSPDNTDFVFEIPILVPPLQGSTITCQPFGYYANCREFSTVRKISVRSIIKSTKCEMSIYIYLTQKYKTLVFLRAIIIKAV